MLSFYRMQVIISIFRLSDPKYHVCFLLYDRKSKLTLPSFQLSLKCSSFEADENLVLLSFLPISKEVKSTIYSLIVQVKSLYVDYAPIFYPISLPFF